MVASYWSPIGISVSVLPSSLQNCSFNFAPAELSRFTGSPVIPLLLLPANRPPLKVQPCSSSPSRSRLLSQAIPRYPQTPRLMVMIDSLDVLFPSPLPSFSVVDYSPPPPGLQCLSLSFRTYLCVSHLTEQFSPRLFSRPNLSKIDRRHPFLLAKTIELCDKFKNPQ